MPLRFPVLKGRPVLAQPSLAQLSVAQPSPAQASQRSPGQAGPGQPKPCQSSAKGFVLPDSDAPFSAAVTLRFWSVFGLFGAAVPLRSPVLKGRPVLAQPSLAQLSVAQPSPAQASQRSPGQAGPGQPKPCQSSAKGFVLPDSDAPFSAAVTLRFWSVFAKVSERLLLHAFGFPLDPQSPPAQPEM